MRVRHPLAFGCDMMERMDAAAGEVVKLGVADVHVLHSSGSRSGEHVVRRLLSQMSLVPANDIELEHDCSVCGARHGCPRVAYPTTPSGGRWYVDGVCSGGVSLAAASMRRAIGVGLEPVSLTTVPEIDAAAFHPSERVALDALAPASRARVRALLWSRKTALLRAIGHNGLLEPDQIAVSIPDGEPGRVLRSAPELDELARDARFFDQSFGAVVGSVAVLA